EHRSFHIPHRPRSDPLLRHRPGQRRTGRDQRRRGHPHDRGHRRPHHLALSAEQGEATRRRDPL
ncbi:MAG: hypothetical protein AVDCRST_MAG17-853, partial [uncultured Solirubrobacterales bacterium]